MPKSAQLRVARRWEYRAYARVSAICRRHLWAIMQYYFTEKSQSPESASGDEHARRKSIIMAGITLLISVAGHSRQRSADGVIASPRNRRARGFNMPKSAANIAHQSRHNCRDQQQSMYALPSAGVRRLIVLIGIALSYSEIVEINMSRGWPIEQLRASGVLWESLRWPLGMRIHIFALLAK